MTINHLNLTVPDPIETSAFLARHFDLRAGGGNAGMQVLHDDHGMVLTLIKARREDLEPAAAAAGGEAARRHRPVPEQLPHRLHPAEPRARERDQRAPAAGWRARGARLRAARRVDVLFPRAGWIHDRGHGVDASVARTRARNFAGERPDSAGAQVLLS